MNHELIDVKAQHELNYRNAVLDNIKNNTNVLVDQDIMSLLKKPPLDSMDFLKNKFLDLAKKNKIVLNTDALSNLFDHYYSFLPNCCSSIKDIRVSGLQSKVEKIELTDHHNTLSINKNDFVDINKKIKKILKDQLNSGCSEYILKNIDDIFSKSTDSSVKKKIIDDISKYVRGNYQRQLLENFDIKILVKDTTLINSTKEQTERYLFTLNNSRLLNDFDHMS